MKGLLCKMNNTPWPGATSGYCSNVHAGSNLDETISNLKKYTLKVKQIVSPHEPMPVGLWLSAESAHAIDDASRLSEFKAFLDKNDLITVDEALHARNCIVYGERSFSSIATQKIADALIPIIRKLATHNKL